MLDSFCGLYCGACLCNIVPEYGNIEEVAKKRDCTVEQLTCTDCKTALIDDCSFYRCCTAKGIRNCSECEDMPCEELIRFSKDGWKHHATTIPNLYRIREVGLEKWLEEQKQYYTCPDCGRRTGWSYKTCDQCGRILDNESYKR